jgi:hypothetical protein
LARIEDRIPPDRRQTLYTEIIAKDIKLDKLEGKYSASGIMPPPSWSNATDWMQRLTLLRTSNQTGCLQ